MKTMFILVLLLTETGCMAMGSKSVTRSQVKRERKDADKLWRPCQDFEVSNTETRNPIGKLCSRTKGKSKIKNFCNKEDFLFFRSGSFVFIDEDNL